SNRLLTHIARRAQLSSSDLVMGHPSYLRRFSGNNRRLVDLGSRTPGAFSSYLHATTVAQLVSEGRVHHRWLYVRAGAAFRCELGRIDLVSALVDDSGNPAGNIERDLHCLSLCAGQGARHVAKPTAATAPVFPGTVAGFCCVAAGYSNDVRRNTI